MVIFRGFRRFLEAMEALTLALVALNKTQQENGPAIDRLDALERSRHQFEAECVGLLAKADGRVKVANSSEQRERQIKKANERLSDPFRDEGEAPTEGPDSAGVAIPADAGASPPEGVPPVRLVLASNDKAHAVRTKWGM